MKASLRIPHVLLAVILIAACGFAHAASLPSVTTPTSTGITYTTATLGGNVTGDGGAMITARGVVYAPTASNSNPRIGGTSVTKVVGTGTSGVFTINVSGLAPGTPYSFAAYATNSVGTGYSATGTFNTLTPFTYTVSGGVVTITGYTGTPPAALAIPAAINGLPVTSIGDWVFSECNGLTSVTIPGSVTSIGSGAFSYCTGLTAITVDAASTAYSSISGVLFNKLATTLVVFPAGKSGAYTIPGSVASIGIVAFSTCTGLTSVTIPGSVTSIGDDAFSECTGLTSVTIPGSVTSIGDYAFYGCTGLTSITVDAASTTYSSISGVLFNKLATTLVAFPAGKSGAYTIPGSVTSIVDSAFVGCTGLTSVTIPGSVTSMGDAFYGCTSLTEITVNAASTTYSSISGVLFNKLATTLMVFPAGKSGAYTIPGSVTSIADSAFEDCSSLTGITIPGSVTSIGAWTFGGCSGLTSVTIPGSVTSIGDYAFAYCTGLTSAIFEDNAPTMGSNVFADTASGFQVGYYSGATGFTAPTWNSNGVDTYPSVNLGPSPLAFTYTVSGGAVTITGYNGTAGTVSIPAAINSLPVTSIGDSAFALRTDLAGITIPGSVTSIGVAFYNCTGLMAITVDAASTTYSSISGVLFNKLATTLVAFPAGKSEAYTIPGSVTSIADWAFEGCSSLTGITIPGSVTSIGDAFYGCAGLTSITVVAASTTYSSISGVLFNKLATTLVAFPAGKSGAYTIPGSVASIGDDAFGSCSGLTSVTIPNSVISIGDDAFSECSGLTSITIPNSVTSIGGWAFSGCRGLTVITIPGSVTSIGSSAFSYCTGLTAITVDAASTAYSSISGVLFNKSATTLVVFPAGKSGAYTIPGSVTSIGDGAFDGCSGLTSITIPGSVTSIGSDAFDGCVGLTSITIPGSVNSIGEWAFVGCSSLTSITIPGSVTSIGDWAFAYCSGLTSAIFAGNAPTMGSNVFADTASGFQVKYYSGATGFTAPTWNSNGVDTYPSVNLGPSPSATWLVAKGYSSTTSLLTAVPKLGGTTLLMAYALNLDPTKNQAANMPKAVVTGGQMSYTYYTGNSDVTYQVQVSADLKSWSAAGVSVSTPDGNGKSTATVPLTSGLHFFRLVVFH